MTLEMWQQFGLLGMMIGALFYTVYCLGKFAVSQWTKNVGQAMDGMATVVRESSDRQTDSFQRYEKQNQKLTRILIQLVCAVTGKSEPINLDDLENE